MFSQGSSSSTPSLSGTSTSKRSSTSPSPNPKVKKTWTPLSDYEKQHIIEWHEQGYGATKIAQSLGRPIATVSNHIKKFKQQNVSPEAAVETSMNSEAENADEDVLGELRDTLKRRGYSPKQVLSFQETGLVWKMMAQLTNSGPQADLMSLLLGGNAEGDWKFKPLLVYNTETPRALRGYIKDHFPVIWKAHPQLRVTKDFLQSYVVGYLSPACKEYAAANDLSNKFLLILDRHSAYPPSMGQWAENIEVVFLPNLLQLMDKGVTDIFKQSYHRRVMQQLVKDMNEEDKTPEDFWRQYDIKKAIHNISHSWNQVDQPSMNGAWYEVWPEAVHDSWGLQEAEEPRQQLTSDIVELLHQAKMEVTDEQVEDLLASHAEIPSEAEVVQLEPEDAEDLDLPQGLSKTELKKLLDTVKTASLIAEKQDLNMSRSDKFSQALESAARSYQQLYDAQ